MKLKIVQMGDLQTGVSAKGNEWEKFSFKAEDGLWYSGFVDKNGFGRDFKAGMSVDVEVETKQVGDKTYRNVKPMSKEAARLEKAAEVVADHDKRIKKLEAKVFGEESGEPEFLDEEFNF